MDKVKQWVALTIVGALAVLGGGWFVVVSPKRTEAADLRSQAEAQHSTNLGLQAKLATLKVQAKDLPKQQAALAAVAAKVPDNPAMPALIRALSAAASEAGVELVSLNPTTPSPVLAAAPTAAQLPASTDSAGTTTSTTPKKKVTAPSVAVNAGTLMQISMSINVIGGYFQIEQFFDRLENLSRAVRVANLSLAPGLSPIKKAEAAQAQLENGSSLAATINAFVYLSTGRQTTTATVPTAGK